MFDFNIFYDTRFIRRAIVLEVFLHFLWDFSNRIMNKIEFFKSEFFKIKVWFFMFLSIK